MSKKYVIEKISNFEIIVPEIEIIERNIPYSINVNKKEYKNFLKENSKYIGESYSNTAVDSYVVKDKYGNMIARVYFYMEPEYYINPELLKLGIEKKTLIENKTRQIGETRIDLGEIKPCKLEGN